MQVSASGGAPSAAMMQHMRERMFQRADADGNGGLSLSEFTAVQPRRGEASAVTPPTDAQKALFSKLDVNGDSNVSGREIEAAFAPAIGSGPPRGGPPPGGRPPGGDRDDDEDHDRGDKAVAAASLSALLQQQSDSGGSTTGGTRSSDQAKALFSVLDGNGDGVVTLAEVQSAFGLSGSDKTTTASGSTTASPAPGTTAASDGGTATTPAADTAPATSNAEASHRHHHHHGHHGGGIAGHSMASLLLAQQSGTPSIGATSTASSPDAAGGSAATTSGTSTAASPAADPNGSTYEQIGRLMVTMMQKMVQAYASTQRAAPATATSVSAVA